MKRHLLILAAAACLASACATTDNLSDEAEVGTDCFYQNQMRTYEVVDDSHIIVEVTHNRFYLVELWRPVRNLDSSRQVLFQSSTNRVCSRFSQVLIDGGVRIRSIREISDDERDVLMNPGERAEEAPVEGADIENIGEDPEQTQDENQQ